jgi:tRNA(fMet)-specific endonuclease VapC
VSLWILDTDSVSLFQRRHPSVCQRVSIAKPEEIAITIITVEEQLRGRLNIIRQASSANELVSAYTKLKATLSYISSNIVLDFSQDASICYAELLRQKIRIGTQDLRIAAIALSMNGILVTRNRRDFVKVSGLSFEDWTQEAV